MSPGRRFEAITYHEVGRVAGRALRARAGRPADRVDVVGLGVRTLTACRRPGDTFFFYEIEPQGEALALRDSGFPRHGAVPAHLRPAPI